MKVHFERLLFAAVLVLAAGCYGGNAFIAVGQGLLVLAMVASIFSPAGSGSADSWWSRVPLSGWLLVALLVVNVISILVHLEDYEHPFRDIKKLRHLLLPLLVLFLPRVRDALEERARTVGKWAWLTLLAVACLVTVADIINMKTGFHPLVPGGIDRFDRIGGVFGAVMTYAYSMQFAFLVIVGVVMYYGVGKENWRRPWMIFTVVALLVCGAGLFLSGSRGAWLASAIGIVVLVFLLRSKWLLAGFTVCVIGALVLLFATDSRFLGFKPRSDSLRLAQLKTAAVTGLQNPVIGIGFRQFERQCRSLKREYGFPPDIVVLDENRQLVMRDGKPLMKLANTHAHNNYFEAFASTGVLGALALIGFLLFWLREVGETRKTRILFLPAIVGFMVAGCFENSFTDGEITCLVMGFYVASQLMRGAESSMEQVEGVT